MSGTCNPSDNMNTFVYSDIDGSEISTVGSNLISFTLWFRPDSTGEGLHNFFRFS